jgi:hypothetical protein
LTAIIEIPARAITVRCGAGSETFSRRRRLTLRALVRARIYLRD